MLCLVAQSCLTLCNRIDCILPGSSVRGDSPGKNTGVIFPTQGLNSGTLHCRWILYHLGQQGSPKIIYKCLQMELIPAQKSFVESEAFHDWKT